MRTSHDVEKESHAAMHKELAEETVHEAAERGHQATDQYGNSLIQFDPKAEAKLRTKIDFMIIPTVFMLYLFCFIDRANIGNAKLARLEASLGYDYNAILSVFYISYIICEIPANMCCKWLGPGWFIPGISLAFGLCSIATAFVHNFSQMCAVRFVLGIFEAGMLPGIAYYLSRWYRRSELVWRLGLYVVAAPLAGAFGGLLASAILKLDHFAGLKAWRMIFAIEGIITVGLAVISFFTLTDRPATARWLSQEEKDLAISRVKSERVGATEVLDKFDRKKIFKGIFSPVTVGTATIFLLNNVTVQGLAFFAPTIVKTIYPHNTVVSQQLHTVPPYIVGGFFCLMFPYVSWKKDFRLPILICSTPLVIIGYANVVSDTARSSAIGTNVMFGNIGGLIATWSFLPFDGPNYHIGNGLNLATASTGLGLCVLLWFWMKGDNKKRDGRDVDQELAGTTLLEQQDMDWKHPSWRWRP
ncbi:unnamed protein product [Aureobasidium mustum]|uniref:MFS transporter n=1 Tax=Aureobasidium mustum TaxID=2773714 RepID=A0A9N8PKN6_9PEZI|nr:unnamed protein product [Aureobasidium mustum]